MYRLYSHSLRAKCGANRAVESKPTPGGAKLFLRGETVDVSEARLIAQKVEIVDLPQKLFKAFLMEISGPVPVGVPHC